MSSHVTSCRGLELTFKPWGFLDIFKHICAPAPKLKSVFLVSIWNVSHHSLGGPAPPAGESL